MSEKVSLASSEHIIDPTAIVENVNMGKGTQIWKNAFVKNCNLGDYSKINDFSRLENCELGIHSDIQRYAMCYNTSFGNYTYTGRNFVSWYCHIGKFCSISWNVSIGGANHDFNRISQHAFLYAQQFGLLVENQVGYNRFSDGCVIGNDVWVGCNAVICRGVHIGDGAVIAAGAVVTKDVEPYTIVAGLGAKSIKERCSRSLAERLIKTAWWDLEGEVIKNNFELFNSLIDDFSVSKIEDLVFKNRFNSPEFNNSNGVLGR